MQVVQRNVAQFAVSPEMIKQPYRSKTEAYDCFRDKLHW